MGPEPSGRPSQALDGTALSVVDGMLPQVMACGWTSAVGDVLANHTKCCMVL
jgi:hypothetical protein